MALVTMVSNTQHYLLFAEASRNLRTRQTWRFVLQNLETQRRFSASDVEEAASTERLELLAVVRGLEAIEGAAHVTLVTKSRSVARGLKFGISQWRENNWRWERFGKIVSVRDCDLWRRVDRALEFHDVDCQIWHFADDALEAEAASPEELSEPCILEPAIAADYQPVPYRPKLRHALSGPLRQVVGASA